MAGRQFAVTVPSEARYLQAVRRFVGEILESVLDGETVGAIVLALDECCANVIRHRDPGIDERTVRVETEIDEAARRLRFRLRAFCRPDEVCTIKPRDLDDVRPGGLGTHIVQKTMDHVAFEPDPEHAECVMLVLEKRLPAAGVR